MTFTVIGRCERTGQTGIGIATASIAVGGLCPFSTSAGDIITSQAFARPELGLLAVRALEDGQALSALPALLAHSDPNLAFRQVAVLRRDGEVWVHSGPQCRPWCGHQSGRGFAVMGNFLAGRATIDAMHEAFTGNADEVLAERLLRSLEAGRDAGGQADAQGRPARERSAGLRVVGAGGSPLVHDDAVAPVDLRIDLHESAVTALRTLWNTCAQVPHYNALRSSQPDTTPPLGPWEAEHMGDPKPPPVLL
ncbi:MAG: DUF1028 domain-containing protein [Pseudomonadota bacterium]